MKVPESESKEEKIKETNLEEVKTEMIKVQANMEQMRTEVGVDVGQIKTDMEQLKTDMAKMMRSMRSVKAVVKARQGAPVEGLECSVCSTSPYGAVYQCSSGHLLCTSCLATVERCAALRATLPHPSCRNLTAEGCID